MTETPTATAIGIVEATLAEAAEAVGDITPGVYQKLFARSEAADSIMGHSDELMRGRMLQQTIELLLSDEHLSRGGYLDWELENHLVGYGATTPMYEAFFAAIEHTVESACPAPWGAAQRAAWAARCSAILDRVYALSGD